MVQERSVEPSIQCGPGYFFKEESPGGFEDASNFGDARLPLRDMVEHAKVKHGIKTFVRERELFRAGGGQENAPAEFYGKLTPCPANL
jgi:hypothetical protein